MGEENGKAYVLDAEGYVCEVRARTASKVWVRRLGSSYESDLAPDTVTPCDIDGTPLPVAGGA